MSDVQPSPESAEAEWPDGEPIPPRYWWLKRIGVVCLALLLALVALRWWWGWEAHRRLQAEIERYRAAGQLVYAREFDAELDAVRNDQNAAVLLEQALPGMALTTQSGVSLEAFFDELPMFDIDMPAATELMQINANVLDLVHQARSRPEVAWSARLSRTNGTALALSQHRSLAKLLHFAARYQLLTGDHTGAIATIRDYLVLNNAIDSYPSLISSLVAWACYDLSFSLIEEHGADLQVCEGQINSSGDVVAVSRRQVEQLLRDLLSEQSTRRNAARSHYGDRAWTLHNLDPGGTLDYAPSGWALPGSMLRHSINFIAHPAIVLDTIRDAGYSTLRAEAVAEDAWPLAKVHFASETVDTHIIYRLTHPITCTQWGSLHQFSNRSTELFFRHLARRRMAATALAIRLFQLDHGHRPAELNELVAAYLPEVPTDPFSVDESNIRYSPDAEYPILYSVGADGNDDGGVVQRRPDGRRDSDRSDVLFYLDGKPVKEDAKPKLKPSPDAEKDNEDVDKKKRQSNENKTPQK